MTKYVFKGACADGDAVKQHQGASFRLLASVGEKSNNRITEKSVSLI